MTRNILYTTISTLISFISFTQNQSTENDKYGWVDFDNDLFFKTDRYYTNGIEFGYMDPIFKKSPFCVLLYKNREKTIYYSGVSITQEMYTPTNTDAKTLQTDDRPYAGTLYITQFADIRFPEKNRRIITSFSLGLIGPSALTEQTQTFIHRITPSSAPEGWHNQIQQSLLINYYAKAEQGITSKDNYLWMAEGSAEFGTYKTNLCLGTFIRFGRFNNYYNSLPVNKNTENWQLYGTLGFTTKMVIYDATLQGGFDNNLVETSYNIKRLVANGIIRLTASYKHYLIEGKTTLITQEFEGGEIHKYFTLTFGIGF